MDGWCWRSHRGVDREGEAPEMVGVAVFVAGGGDGDASVRGGAALRFAQILAQLGVDRMPDPLSLIELEQAQRESFGNADIFDF